MSRPGYLRRGFLVWLLIAVAESVQGTLRTKFLAPVVGDLASRQLGLCAGSLVVLLVAWATVRLIGASGTRALMAVGLLWLVLMLCFEVAVGRAFGMPWERILADYLPWRGGFMVVGMAVLAFAPWIAGRAWRAAGRSLEFSSHSSSH